MQVARVVSPVSSRESWTVLGDDDAPVAPVERSWLLGRGFEVDQIGSEFSPMLLAANRVIGDDGTLRSAREIADPSAVSLDLLQRLHRAAGLAGGEDPDVAVQSRADAESAGRAALPKRRRLALSSLTSPYGRRSVSGGHRIQGACPTSFQRSPRRDTTLSRSSHPGPFALGNLGVKQEGRQRIGGRREMLKHFAINKFRGRAKEGWGGGGRVGWGKPRSRRGPATTRRAG